MSEDQVPDIVLERYRLNELPLDEQTGVARLLERDMGLRARLDALEASDGDLEAQDTTASIARGVQQRMRHADRVSAKRRPFGRGWMLPAALLAVTTMLILAIPGVVSWRQMSSSGAARGNDTVDNRVKGGGPSLAVFRRTPRGSETLADGDLARTGDLIRVGYRAAGRPFGVIVSLDGRGSVTLHLPASGRHAAALTLDGIVLLDAAYELDDAPRWERFYFVTSAAPFDADTVVNAARLAGVNAARPPEALPLPRTLEQSGITLQKEVKP